MNDKKRYFKNRLIVLLAILSLAFAVGAVYYLTQYKGINVLDVLTSLFSVAVLTAGFMFLSSYLKRTSTKDFSHTEEAFISQLSYDQKKFMDAISNDLDSLKNEIRSKDLSDTLITDDQKQEFVNSIKTEIEKTTSDSILNEIKEEVRKQEAEAFKADKQQEILKSITKLFNSTFSRLNNAINDQYKRGNLNLIIGIFITIIGLAVLGYYVQQIKADPNNPWHIAEIFFPRLSLVILIEVFAFFFLKLYKTSLIEIKFFQNELTNFEAKFIAFYIAYQKESGEMSGILMTLANTERNIVLEKGQTTAEIEREKMDMDAIKAMLNSLLEVAKKSR